MVKIIKKNVIIILFDLLIMKCIFKKLKKSTLFLFDDNRCYVNNNDSLPWK